MNIVTIANRLPVRMGEDGWELSPGGLVTALRPVMATHSSTWVGWDGGTRGVPATMPDLSVRLLPVGLSASQVRQYYHGFANASLWPLLHDAIEKPRFERAWWQSYQSVNAVFADKAVTALRDQPDALAWVHDYQLMLVPRLIRERCPDQPIGFFLHVPWPPPDIFARLPWRQEILLGLLGADVVSFHTEGYRRNFVRTCGRLLADTGVQIHGSHITLPDRRVVVTTSAPISIDAAEFTRLATDPADRPRHRGAPRAVRRTGPCCSASTGSTTPRASSSGCWPSRCSLSGAQTCGSRLAFLQIAVPSRDDVPEYRTLRATVERHIGRINGRFTEPGSDVPVHYLYRSLPPQQLAAYYAAAEALLVTPLIDGMNLVAKEYVTVQYARRGSGALVLSEFTGAAAELREAVPCNPFDVEGLSYRIEYALGLHASTRRAALATMARRVRAHDVYHWVDRQLAEIGSRGAARAAVTA